MLADASGLDAGVDASGAAAAASGLEAGAAASGAAASVEASGLAAGTAASGAGGVLEGGLVDGGLDGAPGVGEDGGEPPAPAPWLAASWSITALPSWLAASDGPASALSAPVSAEIAESRPPSPDPSGAAAASSIGGTAESRFSASLAASRTAASGCAGATSCGNVAGSDVVTTPGASAQANSSASAPSKHRGSERGEIMFAHSGTPSGGHRSGIGRGGWVLLSVTRCTYSSSAVASTGGCS